MKSLATIFHTLVYALPIFLSKGFFQSSKRNHNFLNGRNDFQGASSMG